jgi:hypothetical protein
MTDEQLIADAKEAGFSIEKDTVEIDCDWQKTWEITYELATFAAIRDARKDAEIARLREALNYLNTINEVIYKSSEIDNVIKGALVLGEQNE